MSFVTSTNADEERLATSLVDRALDLGINFFDTADVYGPEVSETLLGRAIKGRRDRLIVATKFGNALDRANLANIGHHRLLSGFTAILAAIVHVFVEKTVWPETPGQWLAIIALGVGPVGAAFFTWDIGMKRGDIRVLGAASYATPLLSTAFLILAGYAKPTVAIAIAAILIAGGGLIAAKDMFRRKSA